MKDDEDDVPVTVGYVVALPHGGADVTVNCFVWKMCGKPICFSPWFWTCVCAVHYLCFV